MQETKPEILLIEDDIWFAGSLAKVLSIALPTHNLKITTGPTQAMARINRLLPKLIIADLNLGNQNFLTLLNELATYPDTLKLPKIILSSSGGKLNEVDLNSYGVAAVLDKATYSTDELIDLIKKMVTNHV